MQSDLPTGKDPHPWRGDNNRVTGLHSGSAYHYL